MFRGEGSDGFMGGSRCRRDIASVFPKHKFDMHLSWPSMSSIHMAIVAVARWTNILGFHSEIRSKLLQGTRLGFMYTVHSAQRL
mmetsp:Transcript_47828/g.74667  ORF Transcript_47828/g.74667 Transcript_47828/m.74667 type:complete len:84 (-) Transcript_47828:562-813(-)